MIDASATSAATTAWVQRSAPPITSTEASNAAPPNASEIRSRGLIAYHGRSGTKTSSPGSIGKLGRSPSAIFSTGSL